MKLISLYLKSYRLSLENTPHLRDIALDINFHESNLSKVENGKTLSNNIIFELLKYYGINRILDDNSNIVISQYEDHLYIDNNLNIMNTSFIEKKNNELIDNIYYLNAKPATDFVIKKDYLYFPYEVLQQYILIIMHSYNIIKSTYFNDLEKMLCSTIKLFDDESQILFKLMQSCKYRMNAEHEKAEQFLIEILEHKNLNKKIEFVCKLYLFEVYIFQRRYSKAFILKNELIELLKKYPCKIREIKLLNTITSLELQLNDFDQIPKTIRKGLELAKGFDDNQYAILTYNLGWVFSKQKKYKDAIPYYLIVLNSMPHNTACFELAWSYYELKDYENALTYISKCLDKDMPIYKAYSNDLSKWLEAMIKTPYYKKCEQMLLKILEKYDESIHPETRLFIYTQLLDYYKTRNHYRNALRYAELIINEKEK